MLEAEKHTLDVDLKSLKESANRETHELKLCITELKSQHENERHYLNDNLAQVRMSITKEQYRKGRRSFAEQCIDSF